MPPRRSKRVPHRGQLCASRPASASGSRQSGHARPGSHMRSALPQHHEEVIAPGTQPWKRTKAIVESLQLSHQRRMTIGEGIHVRRRSEKTEGPEFNPEQPGRIARGFELTRRVVTGPHGSSVERNTDEAPLESD